METIFFTLCSNNYLAYAKTLGDSINNVKPGVNFIIGLVDKKSSEIDYNFFKPYEILAYDNMGYSCFDDMVSKYDIIEFNTSVKPFYFEFLFSKYSELKQIFYFDPDLFFYQSVDLLFDEFDDAEILLTPSIINHNLIPSLGEFASLRHGMFNLGFIGLRRGNESFKLIQWWKERLKYFCRIDKCNGIFVDQKWMDLAPLFFNKIKIVKSPGWNMAWWNFNERKLINIESGLAVNEPHLLLVFFHFSGFRPEKSKFTERLSHLELDGIEFLTLKKLYEDYRERLLINRHNQFTKVQPLISLRKVSSSPWQLFWRKIKSKLNKFLSLIF